MSATLAAQSLAWDRMSHAEKQAAATVLVSGNQYEITGAWGTAVVRCLNAETKQFRIQTVCYHSRPDEHMHAGYLATLCPEVLATLKPWPQVPTHPHAAA